MLDFSVTFIITIINIAVLFFILRAVLFKPVTRFIDERTQKVQDIQDQAEKYRSQAKALLAQYDAQLKKIEEDGAEIIRAATETANEEAARIVAEGKAGAERYLEKARKQLEAEQQTAMAVFSTEAAALVLGAAGHLLRRSLNDEDSREQAAILLRELGKRHVPS
ncbi:MAG: ATP synthase F0 subunit B [Treponema sp.]|jgi:F-type H+-transporting ATPase subunit b|nr:ATP synthase F0 subunit B [Treponema sp.]